MRRTLTLLGATGSIGDSTLDVVARHPDRFRIGASSLLNDLLLQRRRMALGAYASADHLTLG